MKIYRIIKFVYEHQSNSLDLIIAADSIEQCQRIMADNKIIDLPEKFIHYQIEEILNAGIVHHGTTPNTWW